MIGRNLPRSVRLKPDRLAAFQRHRVAVAETAHALQGPEIMVEGAVFHHQDHHMADIFRGAGALAGGYGQRTPDAGRKNGSKRTGSG